MTVTTVLTSEAATAMIGNRFDMVIVASIRAKELMMGAKPMITPSPSKCVTALREIEQGLVKIDYLQKLRPQR